MDRPRHATWRIRLEPWLPSLGFSLQCAVVRADYGLYCRTAYRLPLTAYRSRVLAFQILLGGSIETRSAGEGHNIGGRGRLHLGESGLGAGEVLAVAGVFTGPDTVPKLRVGVAAMLFDQVLEKTHPPPRMREILRGLVGHFVKGLHNIEFSHVGWSLALRVCEDMALQLHSLVPGG